MTPLLVAILVLLCLLGLGLIYILLRVVRLDSAPNTLSQLREFAQRQDMTGSSLIDTTNEIRTSLNSAQRDLAGVQAHLQARQEQDKRNADALHWLETVIAGTKSKGMAGENILEVQFSQLPPDWQVRNYHVQGGMVEFGLRLPNNMVLPIDSKIPATSELRRFNEADDPELKRKAKDDIEREVLKRVAEVRKYLDPNLTIGFGLAVVPDGVYELCGEIVARASALNVLVINYSMFLPYILLTYKIALAACSDIDHYRLEGYIRSTQEVVSALQDKLEGSYKDSLKRLNNGRDEMAGLVSQLSASLANLRQYAVGAETPEALPENDEGEFTDAQTDGREQ
ncbi:MAG: DNA recombination protein RmuC [Chloroflexi bacterium]|nr:DNA recombination protein RmuC [Chloroflexota bacterium]